MSETPAPQIKVSAIVTDLTGYMNETSKFEAANKIIEKHVSSQIVQLPNPAGKNGLKMPGQPQMVTTVMISVVYIHEVVIAKMEVLKD